MILGRDRIGLSVIMAGIALLLAFYSIMLWWRTQWQSSKVVAALLLVAVALLCACELCVVYVTAEWSLMEMVSKGNKDPQVDFNEKLDEFAEIEKCIGAPILLEMRCYKF